MAIALPLGAHAQLARDSNLHCVQPICFPSCAFVFPSCSFVFPRYSFLGLQLRSMMPQVIFHESGDKKVTVIVALLAAKGQWLAGIAACGFEYLGVKLVGEELVRQPLIHEGRSPQSP